MSCATAPQLRAATARDLHVLPLRECWRSTLFSATSSATSRIFRCTLQKPRIASTAGSVSVSLTKVSGTRPKPAVRAVSKSSMHLLRCIREFPDCARRQGGSSISSLGGRAPHECVLTCSFRVLPRAIRDSFTILSALGIIGSNPAPYFHRTSSPSECSRQLVYKLTGQCPL